MQHKYIKMIVLIVAFVSLDSSLSKEKSTESENWGQKG